MHDADMMEDYETGSEEVQRHKGLGMAKLGRTYKDQGRWEEAEKLEVQVMETRKTKLGADHPDTLTSMANLAFTWKDRGRHADAVALMTDGAEARQRILGRDRKSAVKGMGVRPCTCSN